MAKKKSNFQPYLPQLMPFDGYSAEPQPDKGVADLEKLYRGVMDTQRELDFYRQTQNMLQTQVSKAEESRKKGDEMAESLREEMIELRRSIGEVRDKTLEPLAIFVGLFTFASISFQIFGNIHDYELWSALLVIITGVLIIFSGLVVHASSISIDVPRRRNITAAVIVMGLLLCILGAALYSIGSETLQDKYNKECIEMSIKNNSPADDNHNGVKYCKVL